MSDWKYTGRCELCGTTGPVRVGMVRWRFSGTTQYDTLPRCIDHAACQARVEATGEEWGLDEPEPFEEEEVLQ